jgi:S1-C subfamily serine protease
MRNIINSYKKRLVVVILVGALALGAITCAPMTLDSSIQLNEIQQLKRSIAFIRTHNSSGSGVVVSEGGLVLTNRHVIEGAKHLTVTINLKEYTPIVLYVHPVRDLALLWVHDDRALPSVAIANYKTYAHGDTVHAIGNPLGISKFVSRGIVSKFSRRQGTTWVWHDAVILEGSSGGGLFSKGKLIGINTLRLKQNPGGHDTGIGLAIASRDFITLVNRFKKIYG